jgi:hypothetical protein
MLPRPQASVYGEDMSRQYVAMGVMSLSPSEGHGWFGVFTIVKGVIRFVYSLIFNITPQS